MDDIGTTACKWDVIIPFDKLWEQYKRVIKSNGAIILTGSQPFTSLLVTSNLKMFKYCMVYEKTRAPNYLQAKKQVMKYHEDICVFYNNQCTYNPQMVPGKPYKKVHRNGNKDDAVYHKDTRENGDIKINSGERYPSSIIKIKSSNAQFHPTEKPVELGEYLIKTYTNEGELVLDNCCGSGSFLLAAKNLGRNYIGMEKEEKYYNISLERLNPQDK